MGTAWNFTDFDSARNVTPELLRQCARFDLGPGWLERVFGWLLPPPLARMAGVVLPTHVWLLGKR